MPEFNLPDLKVWRKNVGLTQQELADKAQINLLTLRKLEAGTVNVQQRTFNKMVQAMREIEAGTRPQIADKPAAAVEPPPPAPVVEVKAASPVPPVVEVKAAPPPPVHAERQPSPHKIPIVIGEITHLDLELIRHVLTMSAKEKIKLLETMM